MLCANRLESGALCEKSAQVVDLLQSAMGE